MLDADEQPVQDRIEKVISVVNQLNIDLGKTRIETIVQNRCIETWLLGNRKIFIRQPQDEDLRDYINHYNVSEDDPEQMPDKNGFISQSQFHYDYLKRIFRERGISYSKSNPGYACDKPYLEQLIKRGEDSPEHLQTFTRFLFLCKNF